MLTRGICTLPERSDGLRRFIGRGGRDGGWGGGVGGAGGHGGDGICGGVGGGLGGTTGLGGGEPPISLPLAMVSNHTT